MREGRNFWQIRLWERIAIVVLVVAAVLVALAKTANGQQVEHGRAFTKMSVTREQLVNAILTNNKRVLRVTPEQYLQAMEKGSNIRFGSVKDMAAYLSSLSVRACKEVSDTATLSRIMEPSGEVRMDYYRHFSNGEQCLYENNSGLNMLSLQCGNVIDNVAVIKGEVAPEPVARAVAPATLFPGRTGIDLTVKDTVVIRLQDTLNVRVIGATNVATNDTLLARQGFLRRHWKPLAIGAAFIAAVALVRKTIIAVNVSYPPPPGKSGGPVNAPNGIRIPIP